MKLIPLDAGDGGGLDGVTEVVEVALLFLCEFVGEARRTAASVFDGSAVLVHKTTPEHVRKTRTVKGGAEGAWRRSSRVELTGKRQITAAAMSTRISRFWRVFVRVLDAEDGGGGGVYIGAKGTD